MDDESIVELYWQRNQQAIAETDSKFGKYCHTIAHNILNSTQDSEECVNDTWLKAWDSMPPKRPPVLKAFLGKITRNLSINRLNYTNAQKRGNGQYTLSLEELSECIPSGDNAEKSYECSQLTEILNSFLAEQNDKNRRIFLRRYWYFSPVKDIAKDNHTTQSAIKMRLMRMRKELKELLEREGFEI